MQLAVSTILDLPWLFEICPPDQILAEHRAIHYKDLTQAVQAKKFEGFEVINTKEKVVFMKRNYEILELIPSDWDEHEAYVVEEPELIEAIKERITQKPHCPFVIDEHHDFELFKYLMLKHKRSENFIQIIWRSYQLV